MNRPSPVKSRIAPTPSGFLHPGNGLSFLLTWVKVRAANGQLLLRIDDMDQARCRREYVEDIFETLDWLGIDYDDGPKGPDDLKQNWSQHHRMDMYVGYLNELRQKKLLFACRCSRKQRREDNKGDGRYSGRCIGADLSFEDSDVAWRIQLPTHDFDLDMCLDNGCQKTSSTKLLDRFFVRQKNQLPAYQLTSLIDDTYFNINYIVRGEDLLPSSWSQLYLAHLFDIPTFSQTTFWHHPLLLGADGLKLSKSKGAGSLKSWRDRGESPQPLIQLAAKQLGLSEDIENIEGLLEQTKRQRRNNF